MQIKELLNRIPTEKKIEFFDKYFINRQHEIAEEIKREKCNAVILKYGSPTCALGHIMVYDPERDAGGQLFFEADKGKRGEVFGDAVFGRLVREHRFLAVAEKDFEFIKDLEAGAGEANEFNADLIPLVVYHGLDLVAEEQRHGATFKNSL